MLIYRTSWSRQQLLAAARFNEHEQRAGYGPAGWLRSDAHALWRKKVF